MPPLHLALSLSSSQVVVIFLLHCFHATAGKVVSPSSLGSSQPLTTILTTVIAGIDHEPITIVVEGHHCFAPPI